ncbi:MAG TPA: HNH endonuclease signature motif containing protein, partial [Angustibacter sp.]|nr:HNH endonuclease signature motif containing protein [Angustibacter sp.]
LRDRTCRTPWCDAPIRHTDHIEPVEAGGATTALNGQGLCEACNYAKQALGWRQRAATGPPGRHTVDIITPTGARHRSTAPPLPRPAAHSRLELTLERYLRAA